MGFFHPKQIDLAEILKGLQAAVVSAEEMLQLKQMESFRKFWTQDGNAVYRPITKKLQLGDRIVEVPLITLVHHNSLALDTVEFKFKAKVTDAQSRKVPTDFLYTPQLNSKQPPSASHHVMQLELENIKTDEDSIMEIKITFKGQEPAESLSRLLNDFDKRI